MTKRLVARGRIEAEYSSMTIQYASSDPECHPQLPPDYTYDGVEDDRYKLEQESKND